MVYAILDALSDAEEMITVAHAEKPCGLAAWFIDEVRDTADMYLSDDKDFEQIEASLSVLSVLAEDDSSEISDLTGMTIEVSDISVSVIGAFYTYEDMKKALGEFLSEKPKYKKLVIPDNPYESEKVIDSLNASLIRSGI